MSTPEQEARAREKAHELLGGPVVGPCLNAEHHSNDCDNVTEFILAERDRLDAANARADGARAAALREAEEIARRRGHSYTRATIMTAHNVVEVAARAACLGVADEIAAFHATPPTSAATTGRET